MDNKKGYEERKSREYHRDGGDKKSFAQKSKQDMVCYCCGKKGHGSNKCYNKDKIPWDQWHVKNAMLNVNDSSGASEEQKKNENKSSGGKKAWRGFQNQSSQQYCHASNDLESFSENLGDVFILDTGSTIGATIMSPKMMSYIKTVAKPLIMVTNAGSKKLFEKGEINAFGEAWYDPETVVNIFGFAKLEDLYRITYDSNIEKAFNVHTNDGIVKFKRNDNGLCVHRPSDEYLADVNKHEQDHEPIMETNLMVQTYHNLPYAMIPKVMLRYLAMISTQPLNYFPAKGGIYWKNCPKAWQGLYNGMEEKPSVYLKP
jgi:hypothetical protein